MYFQKYNFIKFETPVKTDYQFSHFDSCFVKRKNIKTSLPKRTLVCNRVRVTRDRCYDF
jgi:hypothetical protein